MKSEEMMQFEKIRYKDLNIWLKLAVIGGLITLIDLAIIFFYSFVVELIGGA